MVSPLRCIAGNGNAYFHNAYFLRVVHSVVRDCVFHHSTGHGLKITQQNHTLIENCTVTDNRWQGSYALSRNSSASANIQNTLLTLLRLNLLK